MDEATKEKLKARILEFAGHCKEFMTEANQAVAETNQQDTEPLMRYMALGDLIRTLTVYAATVDFKFAKEVDADLIVHVKQLRALNEPAPGLAN